jgi:uncharacterized membrane protein
MSTHRLEAFSDGVIAILITIMVLGLAAPPTGDLAALRALVPHLVGYALSFLLLGIYWNNHHHLFQAAEQLDGRVLWANMHLLFWLSLVPFATGWLTSTGFAPLPVATYGLVFLLAAVAYFLLARALVALHGPGSVLAEAMGRDWKGKGSLLIYLLAVPLAFVSPAASMALNVLVALVWLIPDRRIEVRVKGPGP